MKTLAFLKDEFPKLIGQIKEDTKPAWGIMTAQHVVEHLAESLMLGTGELKVPGIPEEVQKQFYQNTFVERNPIAKNITAGGGPAKLAPLQQENLEKAQAFLLEKVHAFVNFWTENPDAKAEHPVFGALNKEDSIYFQCLHLQHHLKQFGLWSEEA